MKYTIRAILMIGVAIGALALADKGLYAQGADPNAAPNPYKMQESWAQLPNGQKFGAAIKVQVDHSDGKSYLGVRPLRLNRMHEFDGRTD